MKASFSNNLRRFRAVAGVLTLAAMAGMLQPRVASANSTAGATVLNVVTVSYKDAGGTNNYTADASTIVTVNLVKSGLNITNAPSGNANPPALSCLSVVTNYASGSTINFLYALTATANGQDAYNLYISSTTAHSVNNVQVNFKTLTYTGANDGQAVPGLPAPPTPGPTVTRTLGSAIPTRVVNDTTLEFPGGALAGFAVNDIVVVQTTAGPRAYLVTGVNAGNAPVYSHVGNTTYTNSGSMTTPETKGTLTLGAWGVQSITLNGATVNFGGTPAPTFNSTNPATLNQPVGEMILVQVDVAASTNTLTDGTLDFTLTTTDSANGHQQDASCTAGTWKAPTLNIKKEVSNFSTAPGVFAATATGNPGQILEYRVTVTNTGGQSAQVVVTDAVPSYTTLVSFSGSYGGGAPAGNLTDYFARISNGSFSVDVTRDGTDSESQPAAPNAKVGFGKSGATTAAGSALTFYLGDGSANNAGGKIPACSDTSFTTQAACTGAGKTWATVYTILYQVKVD
jgi:uncharacterized repeat protein (TIGR01451 family)